MKNSKCCNWHIEKDIFTKKEFCTSCDNEIDYLPKGETYAEAVIRTDIENLQKVGFTKDQSELIMEIIQKKVLSGGFL